MSDDQLPLPAAGATDFTVVENLAANALPITNLLLAMIEYVSPLQMKRMRLRDAWMSVGAAGPQVNFALAIGGGLRGGENGAYWGRLRRHPLYLSDEDFVGVEDVDMLKNWATVSFLVPGLCSKLIGYLVENVPNMTDSPIVKYRAVQLQVQGRGTVEVEPRKSTLDALQVNQLLRLLVVRVEMLRVANKPEGT